MHKHGLRLEHHQYYAPEEVTNFCAFWDSASKYILPYPCKLRHGGILAKYLRIRYGSQPDHEQVESWYRNFFDLCYSKVGKNSVGANQILIARKIN